jgi:hypothetical protein
MVELRGEGLGEGNPLPRGFFFRPLGASRPTGGKRGDCGGGTVTLNGRCPTIYQGLKLARASPWAPRRFPARRWHPVAEQFTRDQQWSVMSAAIAGVCRTPSAVVRLVCGIQKLWLAPTNCIPCVSVSGSRASARVRRTRGTRRAWNVAFRRSMNAVFGNWQRGGNCQLHRRPPGWLC